MIRRLLAIAAVGALAIVGLIGTGCASASGARATSETARAIALRITERVGQGRDQGLTAAECNALFADCVALSEAVGRTDEYVHTIEAALDLLRVQQGLSLSVVVPGVENANAEPGNTDTATDPPYDDGEWRRAPVRDRANDALDELNWGAAR